MSEVITGIIDFIRNNLVIIIAVVFFISTVFRKINDIQASLENQNLLLNNQKLLLDEQNFTLIRMLNKIETIRLASDNGSPIADNGRPVVDNEQKTVD